MWILSLRTESLYHLLCVALQGPGIGQLFVCFYTRITAEPTFKRPKTAPGGPKEEVGQLLGAKTTQREEEFTLK